jgi:tripartite-type tricarboxylate transporter receptor subunit TctC
VAGGQTSLMMASLVSALRLIQGGHLRANSVTGGGRASVAPEIPSAEKVGMPALAPIAPWFALWGPRGLPAATVTRIYDAVQAASTNEEIRRKVTELGGEPVIGETPDAFAALAVETTAHGLSILQRAGGCSQSRALTLPRPSGGQSATQIS